MRFYLCSLLFLVLAGFACGSILDSAFTTYVWDAGGTSTHENGGGAKTSVGLTATQTIDLATGGPKSDATTWNASADACTATEGAGDTVKVTAPGPDDFANCLSGLIALVEFKVAAGLNGYYFVTITGGDTLTVDGLTYSGDLSGGDDDCDIHVGGAVDGLASLFDNAADLADAGLYNCTVLVRGNETLGANVTQSGGGGTASTMLQFLSVDPSWDRIVPTRTSIGGGKANGPLDTSGMPTFIMAGNFIHFDVDYVQVDGFYFPGNVASHLVGSAAADFQHYSNCVFDNASTNAAANALRSDDNTTLTNCDFIMSGASGASWNVSIDAFPRFVNCRFKHASSGPAGAITSRNIGNVISCVFHDYAAGVCINDEVGLSPLTIINNTFENISGTCISAADAANISTALILGNIAKDCTIFVDNAYGGTDNNTLIAMFNHINNVTTPYDDFSGDLGFQDLTSDPLFVNEGTDDYNLQSGSPANAPRPLSPGGAMGAVDGSGSGSGRRKHIERRGD